MQFYTLCEIYVKFCSAVVIYAVLSRDNFCREFTHFCVENFQALKSASVKKRTNIRYGRDHHHGGVHQYGNNDDREQHNGQ